MPVCLICRGRDSSGHVPGPMRGHGTRLYETVRNIIGDSVCRFLEALEIRHHHPTQRGTVECIRIFVNLCPGAGTARRGKIPRLLMIQCTWVGW
jgi:hypothetical protein